MMVGVRASCISVGAPATDGNAVEGNWVIASAWVHKCAGFCRFANLSFARVDRLLLLKTIVMWVRADAPKLVLDPTPTSDVAKVLIFAVIPVTLVARA